MKRPKEHEYTSHVAYSRALEAYCDLLEQPAQDEPPKVKVSALEFVEMVYEKEHLIGRPIVWAEWPTKEVK